MNIHRYRYIIKVAATGSITAAANQLYVSPSAISQCIMAEEKEHNIKIFDRNSKPLGLTPQGEIYLRFARELLQSYENMTRRLQENVLYTNEFTLSIAIPSILISDFFSAIMPAFQNQYPGAHFKFVSPINSMYETYLMNREVDCAILGYPCASPKITNIVLGEYPSAILAAPPNHPIIISYNHLKTWEKRPVLDLRQIKDEDFILAPEHDGLRNIADMIFKGYNIFPKERIQISNSISILSLVKKGLGFGFINTHKTLIEGESPINFFHLDPSFLQIKRAIYLQHYYRSFPSEPLEYIINLIKQYYLHHAF